MLQCQKTRLPRGRIWCYIDFVKALLKAAKSSGKRPASKWLPGSGDACISQAQAERFTDGLLKIARRINGLPADFARNHDHYLHGLPCK